MVCAFFLLTGATKYVWGVGAVCFGVGLAALGIRLCFAKLTITPDSIRIRGIRTRTISRELVTAVTDTSGTLRVLPIAGWGYIPALVLSDGGRVYLNVRQHVFRDPEHRAQPCGYVGVLSDVLSVPVA